MLARCKFGRGYGAGEPAAGCKGGGWRRGCGFFEGEVCGFVEGCACWPGTRSGARAVCRADGGHVEGQSSAGGRATPGRCAMAGG